MFYFYQVQKAEHPWWYSSICSRSFFFLSRYVGVFNDPCWHLIPGVYVGSDNWSTLCWEPTIRYRVKALIMCVAQKVLCDNYITLLGALTTRRISIRGPSLNVPLLSLTGSPPNPAARRWMRTVEGLSVRHCGGVGPWDNSGLVYMNSVTHQD